MPKFLEGDPYHPNSARVELIKSSAPTKYGAQRTWSELCQRTFASKAEARRGEELELLQRAGKIGRLAYQPKWVLCEKPKITYTADFEYYERVNGLLMFRVVEDVKGVLTRETRVKLAWLKEKYGVEVRLVQ